MNPQDILSELPEHTTNNTATATADQVDSSPVICTDEKPHTNSIWHRDLKDFDNDSWDVCSPQEYDKDTWDGSTVTYIPHYYTGPYPPKCPCDEKRAKSAQKLDDAKKVIYGNHFALWDGKICNWCRCDEILAKSAQDDDNDDDDAKKFIYCHHFELWDGKLCTWIERVPPKDEDLNLLHNSCHHIYFEDYPACCDCGGKDEDEEEYDEEEEREEKEEEEEVAWSEEEDVVPSFLDELAAAGERAQSENSW